MGSQNRSLVYVGKYSKHDSRNKSSRPFCCYRLSQLLDPNRVLVLRFLGEWLLDRCIRPALADYCKLDNQRRYCDSQFSLSTYDRNCISIASSYWRMLKHQKGPNRQLARQVLGGYLQEMIFEGRSLCVILVDPIKYLLDRSHIERCFSPSLRIAIKLI